MRKPGEGKPFDFVHDINLVYFKFPSLDWFYPQPGYSDELTAKEGYKFDGQIFYKKKGGVGRETTKL